VNAEQASHEQVGVKWVVSGDQSPAVICPASEVLSPIAQPGRFRTRSTSHTVAVRDGCTNIPLAAGRAQEDENLSRKRRFRPRLASVRPPGSVRTDHAL